METSEHKGMCRNAVWLIAILMSVWGCHSPSRSDTSAAQSHAVWVWNAEEFRGKKEVNRFTSFCEDNSVGIVFLHFAGNYANIKRVTAACTEKAIRVYALTGRPEMALKKNHSEIVLFIDKVQRYNSACRPEERMRGVHLDVEPYLLEAFSVGSRESILVDYINMLRLADNHLQEKDMLLGADIPFWFDGKSQHGETHKYGVKLDGILKTVSEHVIDLTDYICIMAYRNYVDGHDGIINISQNEVRYASRAGKRVYIGLETGSGESIPQKTTFANKGKSKLISAIKEVEKIFADEKSFAGMAIHHYKSWRELD